MANAAKAAVAGDRESVEHLAGFRSQHEIGMADDSGADARGAEHAGRGHGGDAVDELDFADWLHRIGPIGAVHGAAFDEDGSDDVVAGIDVGQHFVEQIAWAPLQHVLEGMG